MIPIPQILVAQIRGLSSTSAPRVCVPADQIVHVLGLDVVEENNLFYWVSNGEETPAIKRSKASVIPEDAYTVQVGWAEVDRELLLELLVDYKNRHYPDLVVRIPRDVAVPSLPPQRMMRPAPTPAPKQFSWEGDPSPNPSDDF